jgi:hypothetical protein
MIAAEALAFCAVITLFTKWQLPLAIKAIHGPVGISFSGICSHPSWLCWPRVNILPDKPLVPTPKAGACPPAITVPGDETKFQFVTIQNSIRSTVNFYY